MVTRFEGNIFGTVEPGHIFIISGRTNHLAERFHLKFQNGKGESGVDVNFGMSVRFSEHTIVRNSLQNGQWGAEERSNNIARYSIANPIERRERFTFYILVGDQQYHVAINGKPHCTYQFRQPLENIKTILLHGDIVSIDQIDHRRVYPALYPLLQHDQQQIEFSNDVSQKFAAGHVIVITATPVGNASKGFSINFYEGITKKQALHFNPRFGQRIVARNSMNDNLGYGNEENDGGFPFTINTKFKLAIALTTSQFKFAVNGKYFARFNYRSTNQLDKLNGFKLYGDGEFLHVKVESVDHVVTLKTAGDGFESYSS